MGLTTTIVLAGIVLGCLQLAAGVIIGRHFPLQGQGANDKPTLNIAMLERLARRLGLLVNRVADDVGQHQASMARVNRELSQTEADDASTLAEAVLGALAQMVESDARLQERLAKAEQRLQQQAEQIQSQISEARTDSLTELPNRRAFRDELERQIAQWHRKSIPCSLLMIDVDHFKAINDRYGHPAGDHVLREIADVLKGALREMDLVARVGGEEFAAILPSTTLPQGVCAAQRVRKAIENHAFCFEQHELRLTVSLGLAIAEARDNSVSLIRRADEALYVSKDAGRNCGHLHDGQTCQRIDGDSASAAAAVTGSPTALTAVETPTSAMASDPPGRGPVQQAGDPELYEACRGLREKLLEITGSEKKPAGQPSSR